MYADILFYTLRTKVCYIHFVSFTLMLPMLKKKKKIYFHLHVVSVLLQIKCSSKGVELQHDFVSGPVRVCGTYSILNQ